LRRWLRPFSALLLLLLAATTAQAASKPTPQARQEASSASGPTGGPIAPAVPLPGAPEALQAQSPIREISSEEAWAAFTAKTPFLDAGFADVYAKGHVRGAWNLPVASAALDERLVEFEVSVRPQPDTPLVVYCSGNGCPDSDHLATKLFQLGYRKILVYVDGFPDWVAKKRPVDQGPGQK
jgi:rhodanese-related sulfurtransferase